MNVTFSNSAIVGHGGRALRAGGAVQTLIHNITAHGIGCAGLSLEGGDLVSVHVPPYVQYTRPSQPGRLGRQRRPTFLGFFFFFF